MSIPLLLPCPPAPLHTKTDRTKGTSSLLHLGPFGSCQCPSKSALTKSPLLKSRKRSAFIPSIGYIPSIGHIPVVGHNPNRYVGSLTTYSVPTLPDGAFIPSSPSPSLSGDCSLGIVFSSGIVNFSNKPPVISPLRESNCANSTINPRVPFVTYSDGFSPTSESVTSISSQSQYTPTSPTFPIRVNEVCNNNLVKNKFCASSPTHSFTTSTLRKSQSALIMPSLLTFFRSDSLSPQGGVKQNSSRQSRLSRDSSSRSLNVTSRSPSPLIRKCHTVISLSSQGNQPYSTNAVTNSSAQKKQKKYGFFRRLSPSKSAVFSSQNRTRPSSTIRKSTSAAYALGHQRYRKTSAVSILPHGELGMWPHKEHPEEEDASCGVACTDESKDLGDNLSTAGGCSRCTSVASMTSRRLSTVTNPGNDGVFCRLCLTEVSIRELYQLQLCQCRFCTYCMCMYATLKIREGEPVIECPDSNCDCRGELTIEELDSLVGKELVALHLKFRRDREVDLDPLKTWCPRPGCETVVSLSYPKLGGRPQYSCCPTCSTAFCTACSSFWHPGKPCLRSVGCYEVPLNDCIKRCPRCKVPIERDAGCAQMQCKKCKHVFCWYCLASLEDDFLLRHYDKGPCKNKLGHSRASVLLHRAQVVVIFAGFGLLLIIASPLLLFVGPCLLCKSCSSCSRPEADEDVSNV